MTGGDTISTKMVDFIFVGGYNLVMVWRDGKLGSLMRSLRGFSRSNPVVNLFMTGLLRFARNDGHSRNDRLAKRNDRLAEWNGGGRLSLSLSLGVAAFSWFGGGWLVGRSGGSGGRSGG
jgi:hypothetical protein